MSEFVDFLHEAFRDFGDIRTRKMFGGHGVYYDGIMIGLVASDMLYLKADAQSAPEFTARDLPQFMYPKGDKMVGMSYYQAPESALDDPEEMAQWGRLAYESALRSRK